MRHTAGAWLKEAAPDAVRPEKDHYPGPCSTGRWRRCPLRHIRTSGYVVHTLEAALWCLLNRENYPDTVLTAVNLGDDTDTTGAVAGGLAGLRYGEAAIPAEWLRVLARRADIEDLAARLAAAAAAA